ncbi:MAG: hypothetical protein ACHQ9S_24110 [Candidatus Binatia bacterium]
MWLLTLSAVDTGATRAADELILSAKSLKLTPGDKWSYQVSSSDGAIDGKILTVIFEKVQSKKRVFSAQLNGVQARTIRVADRSGWYAPAETKKDQIELTELTSVPDRVQTGMRWEDKSISYTYDANGARHAQGEYRAGMGPFPIVVPAGRYPCAELTHVQIPTDKTLSVIWLNPQVPVAIRTRWRRPNGTAMLLFELLSYEASGESRPAGNTLTGPEREKAVGWMKANNKWGESSQAVDDFIFQLQSGVQEHPGSTLRWILGRGTTKIGRGYRLEWKQAGFTMSELTQGDATDAVGENDISFKIVDDL